MLTFPLPACLSVRSFVWTKFASNGRGNKLPLDLAIALIVRTWKQSDRRSAPSSVEVRGGGGGGKEEEKEDEEEEEESCIVRWPRWHLVSGALSFNVVLFWISVCELGWLAM